MGKAHEQITDELAVWIGRQRLFFVATAPLSGDGLLNCSPKGGDSFRILDPSTVAYQDLTGSGVETVAHLRENGRMVIMFCAFEGPPQIVRLHGTGEPLFPSDAGFPALDALFPPNIGTRAIVRLKVRRVSSSCGYAVPLFDYRGDREMLDKWAEGKGPARLDAYRREKNARSIDGLPGLEI